MKVQGSTPMITANIGYHRKPAVAVVYGVASLLIWWSFLFAIDFYFIYLMM